MRESMARLTLHFSADRTVREYTERYYLLATSVWITADGDHIFHVRVYLGEVSLDAVRVELYGDGHNGDGPVCEPMTPGAPLIGAVDGYLFTARVPADRPASHYTPRVIPHHPHATVPLEAGQILWR